MRDAVQKLKGDPKEINPVCPVDLVVDHSVQVDFFGECVLFLMLFKIANKLIERIIVQCPCMYILAYLPNQ